MKNKESETERRTNELSIDPSFSFFLSLFFSRYVVFNYGSDKRLFSIDVMLKRKEKKIKRKQASLNTRGSKMADDYLL